MFIEENFERKASTSSTIKHSQSYQDIGKIKQVFNKQSSMTLLLIKNRVFIKFN